MHVYENRYRWTKDGDVFDIAARVGRVTQNMEDGKLTFLKPSDDDEGKYLCLAENEDGIARSTVIRVKKAFLESFTNESLIREMEAVEGDPFTLECVAPNGVPKPNIFWMIQTTQGAIKSVDNPRVTLSPETGNLWFSSVKREDAMKDSYYVCSAASFLADEYKFGNRIALKVLPRMTKIEKGLPPTLQYVSPPKLFALKGKNVEIFCTFFGDDVFCLFNGFDIPSFVTSLKITDFEFPKSVKSNGSNDAEISKTDFDNN